MTSLMHLAGNWCMFCSILRARAITRRGMLSFWPTLPIILPNIAMYNDASSIFHPQKVDSVTLWFNTIPHTYTSPLSTPHDGHHCLSRLAGLV